MEEEANVLNSTCLDLLLIELIPQELELAKQPDPTSGRVLAEEDAALVARERITALAYRIGQGLAEGYAYNNAYIE